MIVAGSERLFWDFRSNNKDAKELLADTYEIRTNRILLSGETLMAGIGSWG
jgi:hypothetical protein